LFFIVFEKELKLSETKILASPFEIKSLKKEYFVGSLEP